MKNNELLLLNASFAIGEKIVSVSASDYTTWCITESGDLYGCGRNDHGQQGDGTTKDVRVFTKRAENVAQVKATNYTTWYLTNDNELFGCGLGADGQQGSGGTSDVLVFTKRWTKVVDFACSEKTTWLAQKSTGRPWYGCGDNTYGQQGSGDRNNVLTFTKRFNNSTGVVIATNTNTIFTQPEDSIYREYIYFAGRNVYGQFGNGTTEDILSFTAIVDSARGSFRGDSSGDTIFYLVYPNYPKRAGRNDFGQLGTGNTTNLTTFQTCSSWMTDVFAFSQETSFLGQSMNYDLNASGRNNYGQLGRGNTTNATSFVKVATDARKVWVSNSTSWYKDGSNNLFGCGRNDHGQQGADNTTNVLSFKKRAEGVTDVCANELTTWYLTEDGNLFGCGDNTYGQQGDMVASYVSKFKKRN